MSDFNTAAASFNTFINNSRYALVAASPIVVPIATSIALLPIGSRFLTYSKNKIFGETKFTCINKVDKFLHHPLMRAAAIIAGVAVIALSLQAPVFIAIGALALAYQVGSIAYECYKHYKEMKAEKLAIAKQSEQSPPENAGAPAALSGSSSDTNPVASTAVKVEKAATDITPPVVVDPNANANTTNNEQGKPEPNKPVNDQLKVTTPLKLNTTTTEEQPDTNRTPNLNTEPINQSDKAEGPKTDSTNGSDQQNLASTNSLLAHTPKLKKKPNDLLIVKTLSESTAKNVVLSILPDEIMISNIRINAYNLFPQFYNALEAYYGNQITLKDFSARLCSQKELSDPKMLETEQKKQIMKLINHLKDKKAELNPGQDQIKSHVSHEDLKIYILRCIEIIQNCLEVQSLAWKEEPKFLTEAKEHWSLQAQEMQQTKKSYIGGLLRIEKDINDYRKYYSNFLNWAPSDNSNTPIIQEIKTIHDLHKQWIESLKEAIDIHLLNIVSRKAAAFNDELLITKKKTTDLLSKQKNKNIEDEVNIILPHDLSLYTTQCNMHCTYNVLKNPQSIEAPLSYSFYNAAIKASPLLPSDLSTSGEVNTNQKTVINNLFTSLFQKLKTSISDENWTVDELYKNILILQRCSEIVRLALKEQMIVWKTAPQHLLNLNNEWNTLTKELLLLSEENRKELPTQEEVEKIKSKFSTKLSETIAFNLVSRDILLESSTIIMNRQQHWLDSLALTYGWKQTE